MTISRRLRALVWRNAPVIQWVPTDSVRYFLWQETDKVPAKLRRDGVMGGDWDLARRPMAELYHANFCYRSVLQIFQEWVDTEQCDQYQVMASAVARGTHYKQCHTLEQVHAYFGQLLATYDAIKADGYRSQQELGGRAEDEISVVRGRRGELIFVSVSGNHRMAIAHVLGVPMIPVHVIGVHAQWARHKASRGFECCYFRGSPAELSRKVNDAGVHGWEPITVAVINAGECLAWMKRKGGQ